MAEHRHVRHLQDAQLEAFDEDFLHDEIWASAERCIVDQYGSNAFSFLDVGGGNGFFSDRLLHRFPECRATVVDSSYLLLSRNRPHTRKTLVDDTVENLQATFAPGSFDVIFVNFLLHHLVGDTYAATLHNMVKTLSQAAALLRPGGRLSIFENVYNGYWLDNAPGRMIYSATSSRILTPITRLLGANTAGVGVCFLSARAWSRVLEKAGFSMLTYTRVPKRQLSFVVKAALHLRQLDVGHFWCEPLRPRPARH